MHASLYANEYPSQYANERYFAPIYSPANTWRMENNNEVAKTIANALDDAMRRFFNGRPISQAELSRRSGVPQPTISRTLQGKSIPETETISKLVEVLGTENVKIGSVISSLLSGMEVAQQEPSSNVSSFRKARRKSQRDKNVDEIMRLLSKTNDAGIKSVLLRVREFAAEFPLPNKQTA